MKDFGSTGIGLVAVMLSLFGLSSDSLAGTILVAHDVNTLSTSLAGANEETFAVNAARWLAGAQTGSILAIESNAADSHRDIASGVEDAWTLAGFTVTVTSDTSFTLPDLQNYDVVYCGITYPTVSALDTQALTDYVNGGGGVYTYAGVSTGVDADWMNPFLSNFGFEYNSATNGLLGETNTSTSDHPIFDGVNSLGAGIGNSAIELIPGSEMTEILISDADGNGLYAIYDSSASVPEPSSLAMFAGLGAMGLIAARRRKRAA